MEIEVTEEIIDDAVQFLPKIVPLLDMETNSPNHILYIEVIRNAMRHLLKGRMTFSWGGEFDEVADQRDQFHALLPLVTMVPCKEVPGNVSFYYLAKLRPDAFKFFYNIINCWLMPGKRINVVLLYAVDFHLPEISSSTYTLCELVVHIETRKEYEQILKHFSIVESELRLGIQSSHYAQRILEAKGLTMDAKTAIIQEHITLLMQRFPTDFDQDVITEMQHLIVISPEEFKQIRDCRHISRIICFNYLFRKWLKQQTNEAPHKRHISLKIFRATLHPPTGPRKVLGMLVGINFLKEKEVFERTHLLKAVQNYIPEAKYVEDSFSTNKRGSEKVCTLYLELEKSDGTEFTGEEIALLRKELSVSLKERIETLVHPVFMPRNEEEVMRNILSLSGQIKYLRDIPQVFISYDEQIQDDLIFTVILVRVVKPIHQSIQEMFKEAHTFLEYIHDRIQNAGTLRRRFKKEVTVFHVKLAKEPFLRADHTVDLNKARQTVVAELCQIVGDVRDYNGGMITKQQELLTQFKEIMGNSPRCSDLLLENFFYSLTPVIMRTVSEPENLCCLLNLLLDVRDKPFIRDTLSSIICHHEDIFTYIVVKTERRQVKEELGKVISKLNLQSTQLATAYVKIQDIKYIGYIFRSDDPGKQHHFRQLIEQTVDSIEKRKANK